MRLPGGPQIVERCLRRIAEREGEIRAWVEVAGQAALDASACDGPLAGIPFGAKDIFETRGMATEYGSPLYAGRQGDMDAAVITELRALGAILLGKTQTTAFASFDAAPTRNPRAPGRTPGGSSAGSAAAVAAGMAPFALGTQTLGSVLRPASYCGVCGFKPSFGRISIEGVLPFAPSLDTVGFFTATAAEMQDLWTRSFGEEPMARAREEAAGRLRAASVLSRLPLADARGSETMSPTARFGAIRKPLPDGRGSDQSRDREGAVVNSSPARLARLRVPAEEPMAHAMQVAAQCLRAAGLRVDDLDPPGGWQDLIEAAYIINAYEGARTHERRYRDFGERLGARLAALVRRGLAMPEAEYQSARERVERMRSAMARLFQEYPAILSPAATGPPPLGFAATGDPSANAAWTALGVPAIAVPLAGYDMPMGMQLTGAWGSDDVVVALAAQAERLLAVEAA